jgi:ABC-type nitrate/sulfonate/bicarbonate transport system ATPase subunit
VGVKDAILVAGVALTHGSRVLVGYTPDVDAVVVERLLDAGASIVGKLNQDDFANGGTSETSAFGCVRNPHNPEYSPGGSSSGSGAAVASGDVDIALGVDQRGSGRIPAAGRRPCCSPSDRLWNRLRAEQGGGDSKVQDKLEVVQVSKVFTKSGTQVTALEDISLEIPKGRFVSIIGPSGCGKSTLFNVIAGLIKPSSGCILEDGKDITGQRGHVGYMLQKDLLLPWRTTLKNIILGLEIRGYEAKRAEERALPLIQRYGLGGFENSYPRQLSGGMRQRAALLRTLLYDRDLLLLDEPFGALDAQTRLTMQGWLLQIWSDFHKTVLFVTHDIDESIYLSDVVYVLSGRPGRVKAVVAVDIERPRSQLAMTSSEFMKLKHELLTLLGEGPPQADSADGGVRAQEGVHA